MDDEGRLYAEASRGARARAILEDELVVAFFTDAEREIWEAWKSSPLRDADGREKLRLMQEWLTKFRQSLQAHVMTGKMAMETLDQRRTALDRMKAAIMPRSWIDAE